MITESPRPRHLHVLRPYVPSGACSSCPYRTNCHEARQRVQDTRFAVGRQYDCEFHQEFERLTRAAAPRRSWWRRLLGGDR
jgi:hypothetical protein